VILEDDAVVIVTEYLPYLLHDVTKYFIHSPIKELKIQYELTKTKLSKSSTHYQTIRKI